MKILYAIPWYSCNLSCDHCEIHTRKEEYDPIAFQSALQEFEGDVIVFFGGEPLLHQKEMWEILKLGKINCISTNLLLYKDGFGKILADSDISVATSWNPHRFTKPQFDLWSENLWKIHKEGVDTKVLITLTSDLLELDLKEVLSVFERMEQCGLKKFEFEPYVGDKEYHSQADKWLCKFHDVYKGNMLNMTEQKLYNWNCDCSEVYTLTPNGTLKRGCPMYKGLNVIMKCMTCDKASVCKPCPLLKECSYPKKLAKKLGVI